MVRAPHAAAKLMQLSEPHVISPIDDDRICGRNVDAAFDDGRAHQQVEPAVIEVDHELLEIFFSHLPVADADAGLRDQLLDLAGHLVDGADFIVDEVNLSAAAQLAQCGLAQRWLVPFNDECLDREAFRRRRGDERQIAQATQRHVQCAGDRGRRESQHVDVGP